MKKIFFNGNIVTINSYNPTIEAVYTEGDKIKDLGTFDEIKKYKNSDVEMVDLNGKTMLPGFVEPHIHLDLACVMSKADLIGGIIIDKTSDVINEIKKKIANTPKGEWIFFYGLDYLINRDLPEINRYWIDELTTEHPVFFVIQSMHTTYVNSLALKLAGIDKDTVDTKDGHCYKDENGEPTGVFTEQTFILQFLRLWLKDLNRSPEQLILEETQQYAKNGITTVWTAGITPMMPNQNKIINEVINSEQCPIRGDYSITINSIEEGTASVDNLIPNDDKMKFTGVKIWYDGSPYTGNMFMFENYLENEIMQNRLFVPSNQSGERLFSEEKFYEIIKKYHNMGYQISVHAQGDRANHEVISAFEKLLTEYPRENHRHRLEHCAFLLKEDLEKACKLGILLSFHINHIYYYGEALRDIVVGDERTQKMLLCKSAIDNGTTISLHSDAPMYPAEPLRLMNTAINRETKHGYAVGKNQGLSVTEALKAITIDAAYQIFREKEIGSIEIGKFADFVVLAENPYEVNSRTIGDIEVVTTYLGGIDTSKL